MRLIDADALDWERIEHDHGARHEAVADCEQMVEIAPTIDAVPVVRCKDCKHSRNDELWHMRWCKGVTVKDEHFCADGERRDHD